MRYVGKVFLLAVIVLCWTAQVVRSAPRAPDQPRRQTKSKESVLVGRISVIEGEMLRYVPEAKDWVVTVKDTPFGREDALYLGENGKAEFLMPNNTWIRIGANTQIQMIALKNDATEVDVAAGIARLIDRSSKVVMKATTPFGYVVGAPGSVFDLYVGDESVEVIAIKGKVEFVHDVDGAKYNVIPGSISILADNRQASAGEGKVDAEWDDWNILRDSALIHGIETRGESVKHLPEGIREDSGVLDENGRWETVYYEGENREVWRPTTVQQSWSPYTVGHWTDWYGDYTWVPYEPFGYVTHHYGYWFWANDSWYWAPPAVAAGWDLPRWGIGFGWYPGRVGWIFSDSGIGWFPLLPWEPYYAFNWWGPWGFTVYNPSLININLNRYSYYNRPVIVNQGDFHNVNSYSRTRLTNINGSTLAANFKAAPAVSNNLLKNAGDPKQRFNFTNAPPRSKPAQSVTSRVAQNQAKFSRTASVANGSAIRSQVAGAKLTRPTTVSPTVSAPKIASGKSGIGKSMALNKNPRAVRTSSASGRRSTLSSAGRPRLGHGQVDDRGAKASGGGAMKVGAQKKQSPKNRPASAGQRAIGPRNLQGHGTIQNQNMHQRKGRRPSGSAFGGHQGAGGQFVGGQRGKSPAGGRAPGLHRSTAGISGSRGSAPQTGGSHGGAGHAGGRH